MAARRGRRLEALNSADIVARLAWCRFVGRRKRRLIDLPERFTQFAFQDFSGARQRQRPVAEPDRAWTFVANDVRAAMLDDCFGGESHPRAARQRRGRCRRDRPTCHRRRPLSPSAMPRLATATSRSPRCTPASLSPPAIRPTRSTIFDQMRRRGLAVRPDLRCPPHSLRQIHGKPRSGSVGSSTVTVNHL